MTPGDADIPLTRDALITRWREREAYHEQCEMPGAGIYRQCIGDVERLWQDEDATWLKAKDAARSSGYSEDHLRRLGRTQKVVAEKRRGTWWYLAGSLPRRGRRSIVASFDADEAARETVERLGVARDRKEGRD